MSSITVCILNHNYGRYLPSCLDSILRQTRFPDEILIIDDYSTDNTASVVKKYKKKMPIRYLRHKKNLGLIKTHNHALSQARGDYIFLLSADDYLDPNILEKESAILDAYPKIGLVYSQSIIFKNGKNKLIVSKSAGTKSYIGREEDFNLLLTYGDFLPGNTILVRKKVYQKIGLYDPNLLYRTDHEIKIRIAKHYPLAYLAQPLAYYRIHQNNLHLNNEFQTSYENEYSYILRKHLPQDTGKEAVNLRKQAYYNYYLAVCAMQIFIGNFSKAIKFWCKAICQIPPNFISWHTIQPGYFLVKKIIGLNPEKILLVI